MDEQVPQVQEKQRGPAGWFMSLIVAELALLGVWWFSNYYYTLPTWAWVALGVLGVAVLTLFVLVVSRARHKVAGLLVTLGLVVVIAVAFMVASIFFPGSVLPLEARVRQIAEKAGVTALLPPDKDIEAHDRFGYAPSSVLAEDGMLTIDYHDYTLSESPSVEVLTAAQMETFIKIDQPGPGSGTRLDTSEPEELTVLGKPAIAVSSAEVLGSKGMQPATRFLVFQPEGMVARLVSAPESGLTVDDLVKIAESLEPME